MGWERLGRWSRPGNRIREETARSELLRTVVQFGHCRMLPAEEGVGMKMLACHVIYLGCIFSEEGTSPHTPFFNRWGAFCFCMCLLFVKLWVPRLCLPSKALSLFTWGALSVSKALHKKVLKSWFGKWSSEDGRALPCEKNVASVVEKIM